VKHGVPEARPALKLLKSLQDDFGALHDLHVARAELDSGVIERAAHERPNAAARSSTRPVKGESHDDSRRSLPGSHQLPRRCVRGARRLQSDRDPLAARLCRDAARGG